MKLNELKDFPKKKEELARKLHEWYLNATKALNPNSYNPNAQKPYEKLSKEQQFIDRDIADAIIEYFGNIEIQLDEEKLEKIIQRFWTPMLLQNRPRSELNWGCMAGGEKDSYKTIAKAIAQSKWVVKEGVRDERI